MQKAIIEKDLRSIVSNNRWFPVLIILPLVLTLFIPSIFILVIHYVPDEMEDLQKMLDVLPLDFMADTIERTFLSLVINNIMPAFFALVPIMTSSIMAASSFVGEKEKRTLETLLFCPLSLKQIFYAKVLASFILSMVISLATFFVMLIVVEVLILLTTGTLLFPGVSWLIMLAVVSPAISLMAITLIVRGSAKAKSIEESQQHAAFLVVPILLLIVGQFTGIVLISYWILLGMGVILLVFAVAILNRTVQRITYETILK